MSWNYRIIRQDDRIPDDYCSWEYMEPWYSIMEVYYNDQGEPNGWCDADSPHGNNIEDLKGCIRLMRLAVMKPVLVIRGNKLIEEDT